MCMEACTCGYGFASRALALSVFRSTRHAALSLPRLVVLASCDGGRRLHFFKKRVANFAGSPSIKKHVDAPFSWARAASRPTENLAFSFFQSRQTSGPSYSRTRFFSMPFQISTSARSKRELPYLIPKQLRTACPFLLDYIIAT